MKIKANDYEPNEIIRIIRDWTGLTQKEFGASINFSMMSIQGYELGKRRYTFETLLRIAQEHNIQITIEKK